MHSYFLYVVAQLHRDYIVQKQVASSNQNAFQFSESFVCPSSFVNFCVEHLFRVGDIPLRFILKQHLEQGVDYPVKQGDAFDEPVFGRMSEKRVVVVKKVQH